MEILVCDMCGYELTDKEDIFAAMDGAEAWQDAQINRGLQPRGLFPCKYYFQCKGEMHLVKSNKKSKPARRA